MSDQKLSAELWDLEQIERAGLSAERQLVAHALWAIRNYLRDATVAGLDKPLNTWNISDIIRAAGHGTTPRKLAYAQPRRSRRKPLSP